MDFLKVYLQSVKDRLLNRREIELIYKSLNRIIGSDVQGLKFDEFVNSPIRYDFISNMILVNYNGAIHYYLKQVEEYENKSELINYFIVFSIIHELFHEKQIREQNASIKDIYDYCYSLLDNTHVGMSRVITQVIYNKLHDYLAIEVNANIEAYITILGMVDDDVYDFFYSNLMLYIKKIYVDYDLKDMYRYLGYSKIDEDFGLSNDEDKVRKGVYLGKKITSINDIDVNKIISVN